jgi:hypothetical protein
MFFRRERHRIPPFAERLEALKAAGFATSPQAPDGVRISRGVCATVVQERDGRIQIVEPAGVLMDDQIGALVDGGFQKFFQTASGRRKPALASELKAIHEFEEDLKKGLGLESLYNESLGTVSTLYLYDRLQDRDAGVPKRVWERGGQ